MSFVVEEVILIVVVNFLEQFLVFICLFSMLFNVEVVVMVELEMVLNNMVVMMFM